MSSKAEVSACSGPGSQCRFWKTNQRARQAGICLTLPIFQETVVRVLLLNLEPFGYEPVIHLTPVKGLFSPDCPPWPIMEILILSEGVSHDEASIQIPGWKYVFSNPVKP